MPLVKISLRNTNPAVADSAAKKKLFDIMHTSLVEIFKIPDFDRSHRLEIFSEEDMEIPPNRTRDAVLIEITVYPGRKTETKKALYRRLVDEIVAGFGIPANDISIVLYEPGLECWGIPGGQIASETSIGFDLNV